MLWWCMALCIALCWFHVRTSYLKLIHCLRSPITHTHGMPLCTWHHLSLPNETKQNTNKENS